MELFPWAGTGAGGGSDDGPGIDGRVGMEDVAVRDDPPAREELDRAEEEAGCVGVGGSETVEGGAEEGG